MPVHTYAPALSLHIRDALTKPPRESYTTQKTTQQPDMANQSEAPGH